MNIARAIPANDVEVLGPIFLSLIEPDGDNCWNWRGPINNKGYGSLKRLGLRYAAHRFSMVYFGKSLAVDQLACHTCDNPACVNPAHLYAGTDADNARDRVERGRQHREQGEQRYNSRLTDGLVRAIRRSALPHCVLAPEYGVSESMIRKIRNGKAWRHVA